MATGIDPTIYQIIKTTVEVEEKQSISLPAIRKRLEEDTTLDLKGYYADKKRKSKVIPIIEAETNQAINRLIRKKLIVRRGRAKYGLPSIKIRKEQEEKRYIPKKCMALKKHKGRDNWCPVIKSYIGEPVLQCGVFHETDYRVVEARKLGLKIKKGQYINIRGKKPCYFNHRPKKGEIEVHRAVIKRIEAKERAEIDAKLKLRRCVQG